MQVQEDVEIELLGYGPRVSLKDDGKVIELRPDTVIALEGIGTFKGVTLKGRVEELLKASKDFEKITLKAHKESTKRGHASLTTSFIVHMEVKRCSRVLSSLLVAPRFGSYLQESQRRKMIDEGYIYCPLDIKRSSKFDSYISMFKECIGLYKELIKKYGIDIEDARYILPLGTITSLFISTSFENYVGIIQMINERERTRDYLPNEVSNFATKVKNIFEELAPSLVKARLSFSNKLVSYPFSNPYKPSDPLINLIITEKGFPHEPKLTYLSKHHLDLNMLRDFLFNQSKEFLDVIEGLIWATFIEPISLVAYHQSIRHRTVPTGVESIYDSINRALKECERWIVIPPSIKKKESLRKKFIEIVGDMLSVYEELISEGIRKSESIYIIPQAIKIYVIRTYNGFNLLYPQGFIGTRTCSHAQWEERFVAYRIWASILKEWPEVGRLMGEKCKLLGFCPEREWCPIILKYMEYSDEIHSRFNG